MEHRELQWSNSQYVAQTWIFFVIPNFFGCGIPYQYATIVEEHCTNIRVLRLQNASFVATAADLEGMFRSLQSLKVVELDLDSFYGALVRVIAWHAHRFEQLELFVRTAFAVEHSFGELWESVTREGSELQKLHIRYFTGVDVNLLELAGITDTSSKPSVRIEQVHCATTYWKSKPPLP